MGSTSKFEKDYSLIDERFYLYLFLVKTHLSTYKNQCVLSDSLDKHLILCGDTTCELNIFEKLDGWKTCFRFILNTIENRLILNVLLMQFWCSNVNIFILAVFYYFEVIKRFILTVLIYTFKMLFFHVKATCMYALLCCRYCINVQIS